MKLGMRIPLVFATLALGACVSVPSGPSVLVLPGTGKNFDQFRLDEMVCRQYASSQVGGAEVNQAALQSGVTSAVVGAAVGAVAGAAVGGDSRGAAAGAGVGVLAGSAAGTDASRATGGELQRRYDNGFIQCMYAKGHRVPVGGEFASAPGGAAPTMNAPPPPPPSAPR